MLHKAKTPYVRDVYMAYLINGSGRTEVDEFPILEKWMVPTDPPIELIQWDRRRDVKDASKTTICFYCNDYCFSPILGNPKAYIEKLKQYKSIIGLDPSPYDNMPIVVQKSQIYLNLAISYYFGINGIKVIPNVRLGDNRTLSCLDAFPKNTLISIGTHGFTNKLDNRFMFANQIEIVVKTLNPSGIIVYGPAQELLFKSARDRRIPIYQYDSYTMKENKKDRNKVLSEVAQ